MKGRRIVGLHKFDIFAIPLRVRDVLSQTVENARVDYESPRALNIPILVVFAYMANKAQSGTGLEREFTEKVAEVKYSVTLLGVLLRCARYGPT